MQHTKRPSAPYFLQTFSKTKQQFRVARERWLLFSEWTIRTEVEPHLYWKTRNRTKSSSHKERGRIPKLGYLVWINRMRCDSCFDWVSPIRHLLVNWNLPPYYLITAVIFNVNKPILSWRRSGNNNVHRSVKRSYLSCRTKHKRLWVWRGQFCCLNRRDILKLLQIFVLIWRWG